jgi:hypothetical protein
MQTINIVVADLPAATAGKDPEEAAAVAVDARFQRLLECLVGRWERLDSDHCAARQAREHVACSLELETRVPPSKAVLTVKVGTFVRRVRNAGIALALPGLATAIWVGHDVLRLPGGLFVAAMIAGFVLPPIMLLLVERILFGAKARSEEDALVAAIRAVLRDHDIGLREESH